MNVSAIKVFGSIFFIISFMTFTTVSGDYAEKWKSINAPLGHSQPLTIEKISISQNNTFRNIEFFPNSGYQNHYISILGTGISNNPNTVVTDYGLVIATFIHNYPPGDLYLPLGNSVVLG